MQNSLEVRQGQCSGIFLTADVHHMSMATRDQKYIGGTELTAALSLFQAPPLAEVEITVFATGRCAIQEADRFRMLSSLQNVFVGGHTYSGFKPEVVYKALRKISGSRCGPRMVQNLEVVACKRALETVADKQVISWRNHAFRSDNNTADILQRNGILLASNYIDPVRRSPQMRGGLCEVSVNTIPDHDNVRHGDRTETKVDVRSLKKNSPFGEGLLDPRKWVRKVLQQTEAILSQEGLAVILIHPACSEIIDGHKTVKSLVKQLNAFGVKFHNPASILECISSGPQALTQTEK